MVYYVNFFLFLIDIWFIVCYYFSLWRSKELIFIVFFYVFVLKSFFIFILCKIVLYLLILIENCIWRIYLEFISFWCIFSLWIDTFLLFCIIVFFLLLLEILFFLFFILLFFFRVNFFCEEFFIFSLLLLFLDGI